MIPPKIGISATIIIKIIFDGLLITVRIESRKSTCVNTAKINVAILNMMPNSFLENIIISAITIRKAIQAGITLMKIFIHLKTSLYQNKSKRYKKH